jgi:hypothetical protein
MSTSFVPGLVESAKKRIAPVKARVDARLAPYVRLGDALEQTPFGKLVKAALPQGQVAIAADTLKTVGQSFANDPFGLATLDRWVNSEDLSPSPAPNTTPRAAPVGDPTTPQGVISNHATQTPQVAAPTPPVEKQVEKPVVKPVPEDWRTPFNLTRGKDLPTTDDAAARANFTGVGRDLASNPMAGSRGMKELPWTETPFEVRRVERGPGQEGKVEPDLMWSGGPKSSRQYQDEESFRNLQVQQEEERRAQSEHDVDQQLQDEYLSQANDRRNALAKVEFNKSYQEMAAKQQEMAAKQKLLQQTGTSDPTLAKYIIAHNAEQAVNEGFKSAVAKQNTARMVAINLAKGDPVKIAAVNAQYEREYNDLLKNTTMLKFGGHLPGQAFQETKPSGLFQNPQE